MSFIEETLRLAAEPTTIQITDRGDEGVHYTSAAGEQKWRVLHSEDGHLVIEDAQGRRLRGDVRITRDAVHVSVLGQCFAFDRIRPDEGGEEAESAADGAIIAPMTGTVLEVRCEAGQVVEAGTPLVTVEAMKMEHRLDAPAPGKVEAIEVAVGDKVEIGQLLVRLALDDKDAE